MFLNVTLFCTKTSLKMYPTGGFLMKKNDMIAAKFKLKIMNVYFMDFIQTSYDINILSSSILIEMISIICYYNDDLLQLIKILS